MNWWMRFTIVIPASVAVGFAMDVVDHALGRKGPLLPLFVTMPLDVIVIMFLLRDRWEKKPGA